MKVANIAGRLALWTEGGFEDVESASGGLFDSDPQAVFLRWDEFVLWAAPRAAASCPDVDRGLLGPVVPRPRQVFAIGLNYRQHADETSHEVPEQPAVFTKFPSSLGPPCCSVVLSSDTVDWEVELVVVLARGGRDIPAAAAWNHVAGLTAGQDLSDRALQAVPPAQYSMAKSFRNFGPIGPFLVTVDEFPDRDDIALRCWVGDQLMQEATTASLILPVAVLIEKLSAVVELYPGDIIFTGTPSGVGLGMDPPRYLRDGEVVTSEIDGIGRLEQRMVASGEPR